MRKFLLATTALVGFVAAGAAQAATSPVSVTVGGSVDVLAATYHESHASNTTGNSRVGDDFETLYNLNFGVNGKAGNGLEYGGMLSLTNSPDISNGFAGTSNGNTVEVTTADIFLSSAFGKLQLGDSRGATDLSVMAPTVGEGGVYGRYIDFLDTSSYVKNFVVGIDGTDHSTNISYYTPKVGNDNHKVQLGVTFVPQFYNYGSSVTKYNGNTTSNGNALSPYKNVIKGALAYTGTFHPVTVGASLDLVTGTSHYNTGASNPAWISHAPTGAEVQDFTSWGLGVQAAAEGFTFGGNYVDQGRYNAVAGQTKKQQQYGAGLKYEFSKVGVGVSYFGGEGYGNHMNLPTGRVGTGSAANYVKDFNSYSIGGNYAWAPGLTTNVDGVLFDQKTQSDVKNDGYVLLVSQKLAF